MAKVEPDEFDQFNGTIYNDSAVATAMIADGTSNTFLVGVQGSLLPLRLEVGKWAADGSAIAPAGYPGYPVVRGVGGRLGVGGFLRAANR